MQSFSHSFGESTYHLWWITKCRYKILRRREHKYLCRDVLMQVCRRHGFTVQSLAIGDDHAHIIAAIPPTISVSKAFQLFKGASSYALFRIIPNLRLRYTRGHLWAIGGGFMSVGDVEKQTIVDDVDRQNQLTLGQGRT